MQPVPYTLIPVCLLKPLTPSINAHNAHNQEALHNMVIE